MKSLSYLPSGVSHNSSWTTIYFSLAHSKMYRPETVVKYLIQFNVMVTNHGFFFGALDSGLASRRKSVMREIMNTNLTKKTGRNV